MSHREPIPSATLSEGQIPAVGERVVTAVLRLSLLSYSLVGLVQGVAIDAYLYHDWAWWSLPAWLASCVLALIPILGSVAGFYAATSYWHWPVWSAFLFVFPMLGMLIAASADVLIARSTRRGRAGFASVG
jgi:hypothetical protein